MDVTKAAVLVTKAAALGPGDCIGVSWETAAGVIQAAMFMTHAAAFVTKAVEFEAKTAEFEAGFEGQARGGMLHSFPKQKRPLAAAFLFQTSCFKSDTDPAWESFIPIWFKVQTCSKSPRSSSALNLIGPDRL